MAGGGGRWSLRLGLEAPSFLRTGQDSSSPTSCLSQDSQFWKVLTLACSLHWKVSSWEGKEETLDNVLLSEA